MHFCLCIQSCKRLSHLSFHLNPVHCLLSVFLRDSPDALLQGVVSGGLGGGADSERLGRGIHNRSLGRFRRGKGKLLLYQLKEKYLKLESSHLSGIWVFFCDMFFDVGDETTKKLSFINQRYVLLLEAKSI